MFWGRGDGGGQVYGEPVAQNMVNCLVGVFKEVLKDWLGAVQSPTGEKQASVGSVDGEC